MSILVVTEVPRKRYASFLLRVSGFRSLRFRCALRLVLLIIARLHIHYICTHRKC
nr:MAG TPA: hypothetical protein [Caudoviricetes sp.]